MKISVELMKQSSYVRQKIVVTEAGSVTLDTTEASSVTLVTTERSVNEAGSLK